MNPGIQVAREDRFFLSSAQFTAGVPDQKMIQVDGDAYYEIFALAAVDDAQGLNAPATSYSVKVTEQGNGGHQWFNVPVVSNLAFGLGQNPRYLRTPIILPPNTSLLLEVASLALGNPSYNRFDVGLWGTKRFSMSAEEYSARRQRPYKIYAHTPQQISGTTGYTALIQTDFDSDFVVQQLLGVGAFNQTAAGSSGSANTTDINGIRIKFTDLGAGKTFMQNPVPWIHIVNQPDFWMGPNRLLSPIVFRRGTMIQLDVTIDANDVANVGTYKSMQLGFEGYKIKE